ncbi:hypothetical protein RND81_13G074500 [Saponaria officinalis]|uniref:Myosin motor domain-containing protein n=1 Tax=Saponaria officinalis TaxID=3572 RepID=A0AAW1GZQ6_SAPOF
MPALTAAARLMGCSEHDLMMALSTRKIQAGKDTIAKRLTIQQDYEADGIDWTKVDFKDNQECLNLFEKKPLGLLSLLDEESNFPKATDRTFANKLEQHLSSNSCFNGRRDGEFGISLYAGQFR